MNFNDIKNRLWGLEGRLFEDALYGLVWEELERGDMDPVAQARSVEEGGGEEGKTKAAYIKHRVRRLNDQFEAAQRTRRAGLKEKEVEAKGLSGNGRIETNLDSKKCLKCGANLSVVASSDTKFCHICSKGGRIKVFKGHEIIKENQGVSVNGNQFSNVLEAERWINAL